MLTAFYFLLVWVDVQLFDLLLFPFSFDPLRLHLPLLLIQLLLLFTFGAFLLELPSLLIPLCSLLLEFLLPFKSFHNTGFSFCQPFNVLNKSLLNFIVDHSCVEGLLGVILLISRRLNFFENVVFIILYLLKQRLVIGLRPIQHAFLTFRLVDSFLDAVNDFLNFRQIRSLFLLLLLQKPNLVPDLLDLFQSRG